MHILRSSVYEIVAAACKESHFSDEFTGCSKAEIVAYFRLLDHRQESVLSIEVVLEHIEHFQHRVSNYSFLLDFIRYHVKSIALDNAINANKAKQQTQVQPEPKERSQQYGRQPYQQEHRQPESRQINTVQPPVAHARQVAQPEQTQSKQSHHAHAGHTASMGDDSNIVSYSESMHEERVSNDYDSEQPIYGDMSHAAEEYGVERDFHHMDMGYQDDEDYF